MHIFSDEYTATDEVNGKYIIFTNRLCGLPVDKPRLGWRVNLLITIFVTAASAAGSHRINIYFLKRFS